MSTVSAVGYVFQTKGLQNPFEHFLAKKALSGLQKSKPTSDVRLPITINILQKLIESVDIIFNSLFTRNLIKAMYSLAFFALLRVGEFTCSTHSQTSTLELKSIIADKGNLSQGFSISFTNYKHNTGGQAFILNVTPQTQQLAICPVSLLTSYLKLRPNNPRNSSLFLMADGTPVLTSYFRTALANTLAALKLSASSYKTHSFRIGAASWAASIGIPDCQIQRLGRWKSDAFKKYIRNDTVSI